ncbi:MAG: CoA transferase, partial [Pseudomonadota bacterium]
DPAYATAEARLDKIPAIFDRIEEWTKERTKFEVMDACNPLNIPCGPILSMKELSTEESLRKTGTVVEVDHPERGSYLSVGCPIKLSESPVEVVRSPLLGEHTEEILRDVLGYDDNALADIRASGAVGDAPKAEAAE